MSSARDLGLRAIFRRRLPEMHWASIETGSTGAGVPDANYCAPGGHEGWVEFKACRSGWRIVIQPTQVAWITRRISAGGRVILAVRRKMRAGPRRGPAIDQLCIFRGEDVAALAADGLKAVEPLLLSEGGPARWDWDAVRWILRSESGSASA